MFKALEDDTPSIVSVEEVAFVNGQQLGEYIA
jgi:hypothetical protein